MKFKKIILLIILLCNIGVSAQMKVGSNPKSISNNNIYFEIESTNNQKIIVTKDSAKMGLGVISPTNLLHIKAAQNPLRLEGLQTGASSDSLLTVNDSGVVRKITMTSLSSGGGGSWNNVATNTAASSNTQDIYQMGKIGIGTTTPSSSAILDLVATDKALLLPRVANTAAIATPVNGMLIYDNASNCIKGYENGAWTNCYSSGGSSASVIQDCNTNGFQGNFYNGQVLSGTSYSVKITNNSFSSATIAFAAADVVLTGVLGMTVGTPTGSPALTSGSITLVAGQSVVVSYPITGTPSSKGTLTAKWTKLALTCTKTKEIVNAPPTFNCNGATITANKFDLIKDSAYSGTISIPYTVAGGGDTYPAETITSNGFVFTRNAGTYSAPSGSISYTFSGTYTGTTNSVFTINTDSYAGGCAIVIFDAIRGALAQGGCTSCAAYDAAAANAWIMITATEYAQVALLVGAGKYVANDTYMNGTPQTGFYDNGMGVSLTMATSGQTLVPANNFIVAFSIKTQSYTGAIANNLKLKRSLTSLSSGYSDEGSFVTSPSTSASNTRYYWVRKRPSATIGVSAAYIACFHRGGSSMVGINNIGTNWSTNGDVNSFPGTSPYTPFIQVISTPTKQW
jgi:hypothetical protein